VHNLFYKFPKKQKPMRRVLLFITTLLLSISCESDDQLKLNQPIKTKGIVVTDLEHDLQAKELFQNALPKSSSGRVKSDTKISEIYKYFDLEKDIENYSMNLPDSSDEYFENLVFSKIEGTFYGFVLRYTYDSSYIPGNEFRGLIQRFDLEGELIGQHNLPKDTENTTSSSTGGRAKLITQCVVGFETQCTETYTIEYVTDLPCHCTYEKKTLVSTVCTANFIYGWCDDGSSTGSGTSSGWGTGLPSGGGGTTVGGSNSGGGTSPVVVVQTARDNRLINFRSGLSVDTHKWLIRNTGIANMINTYLESQVEETPMASTYPQYAVDFAKWAIAYFKNHPGATWERMVLTHLLINNPAAFVNIPCDQLPKWQTVAQHTPPQSVIDKLTNLDEDYTSILSGDWDIQYIEDASSPIVNMDYFPVTISTLPKDPVTGNQFTPEGFFNHVRKNLNTFFEGNDTEFGPYNSTEATIWNSTNYLGGIMRFDIDVTGPFTQDGSVICSYQNGNVWRFSTIESPRDWSHPVSGTREFGLTANSDGTYTFYTRGVDRVAESTDDFIGGLPLIQSAYDGGDALWTQFQTNLQTFINKPANGGLAQKQTPVISRPDWEKVKAVLRGEKPISDLGCK
jgi:hypothetical protein